MAVPSAADLEPVAQITGRLNALLDHATTSKPEQTVDPPLSATDLTDEVDALHQDLSKEYDQAKRFSAVEAAARQLFYSFISAADILGPAFVKVWNLLDILQFCGDRGKCTPELICWLLEELLDSQTTSGCRTVFDYLESRKERLVQRDFHKKNLVFLRSCNELLRRLSRAEDAIFCGRVFFFLFQTFPLGDKSSVNLRGEFHTENTTKFEEAAASGEENKQNREHKDESAETTQEAETPKPEPPKSGAKRGGRPGKAAPKKAEEEVLTDNELYPIFWGLQQDFSDPVRLFVPENFQSFKKGLTHTINKFKKTPTVVQAKATDSNNKRGSKRKHGDEDGTTGTTQAETNDHFAGNYNPKYLTSRDLFDLELSDMAFQRHILVQTLILLDFLLSLTEKAKKRLETLETTNKSMLYQFTLGEEEAKWATATRQAISSYMSSTLEGKLFNRMVETVLARDKNWIRWKIESCPSIVRDPVSAESEVEARKNAANATRVRRVPEKQTAGISLGFLDEDVDGLESLKEAVRYTPMTIEALVDGIAADELDLEMAMDDAEKTGLENAIANKRWRTLRQARSEKLSLLDKVTPDQSLVPIFKPVPAVDGADEMDAEQKEEIAAA